MTTEVNHWPTYNKRWEFNGTPEEAVVFSGSNGGYEARVQHDFMLAAGMKPEHKFLDYGCGALRGTIRLVDYLNPGNFFGCDISEGLLKEAIVECGRSKLNNIPFLSQLVDSFNPSLPEPFDFILCNSVTVHIEPQDIQDLLIALKNSLSASGKVYVSIHPLDENSSDSCKSDGYRWWYKPSWISEEASKIGLRLSSMPGKVANRIPGQRRPLIPVVNTTMTEWMMEGSL